MRCVYFFTSSILILTVCFCITALLLRSRPQKPGAVCVFHLRLKISMHDKCLENISAIPQDHFKSIWPGNRNHDSASIVHDTLKTLSGRRSFPNSTHHKYYPVVLSIVVSNPPVSDLAAQRSHLALDVRLGLHEGRCQRFWQTVCFSSWILGPRRTGLHLCVGFGERRPREGQLQLRRLHQ